MSNEYTSDSGRSYERVAAEVRARVASSHYPLGSFLPSQRELAKEFGVSRDTVQRVLRELRSEGWIETRQGSGSRVISTQRTCAPRSTERHDRMVTLGSLINRAFEQPEVLLDVLTLTSESLAVHIKVQAERIRAGEIAPQRIALRMLLPDASDDLLYLRWENASDREVPWGRSQRIMCQHTALLSTMLSDQEITRLVPSVDFEIRQVRTTPSCKLYLINRMEAVLGLYKVVHRPFELDDGQAAEIIDPSSLANDLVHYVKGDDANPQGTTLVETMQEWFDFTWRLHAR